MNVDERGKEREREHNYNPIIQDPMLGFKI